MYWWEEPDAMVGEDGQDSQDGPTGWDGRHGPCSRKGEEGQELLVACVHVQQL